jgi:hypothetical protein
MRPSGSGGSSLLVGGDRKLTLPAQRRVLLTAALGFTLVRWPDPVPPVATLVATWLDSWRGLGAILAGMTAQGFNVELKEFPDGWRANFYPVGIAHSIVAGSAYEPTPWRAVQRAAWEALMRPTAS